MRFLFRLCVALVVILIGVVPITGGAQSRSSQSRSLLEGMWSDPPTTPEDDFCFFFCTDAGLVRLNALLDDPANDARSYSQLRAQAQKYQQDQYVTPQLTAAALKTFPPDPAKDPAFLNCEPWGVARQMFAPHQLEIRQRGDHIDMRYGEWAARRTIYLSPGQGNQTVSSMGYSVGRYEGDTLVIETTRISPNWTWSFQHSGRLKLTERYARSADGKRLLLAATMEDPVMLREPIMLKKVWGWSPKSAITPYKNCERPSELFTRWK